MKKVLLILFFISIFASGFSQLTKQNCETILKEIGITRYKILNVVIDVVGTSEVKNKNFVFTINEKLTIRYEENFLCIEKGDMYKSYIPYDKIKVINSNTGSANEYASIDIYLTE